MSIKGYGWEPPSTPYAGFAAQLAPATVHRLTMKVTRLAQNDEGGVDVEITDDTDYAFNQVTFLNGAIDEFRIGDEVSVVLVRNR